MPSILEPELIKPYTEKATLAIGYLYIISSFGVLLGVKELSVILLILHMIQSVLFDNPYLAIKQSEFDNKLRALLFDFAIIAALFMVLGTDVYKK